MLSQSNRLRRSSDFRSIVGTGSRAGTRTVVIHHLSSGRPGAAPRVGFVVSKAVGTSVVRHRVSRRLRAILALRLNELAAGSGTVVRALPPAATASSSELRADVDRALGRAARSAGRQRGAERSQGQQVLQ